MAGIFRESEENTAAQYEYRARILTLLTQKRPPSRRPVEILTSNVKPQSFQLGSLRPGHRRADLTVFIPLRPALLAGTQITAAQTMAFEGERLWSVKSVAFNVSN
jgi:hypothetical protein